MPTWIWTGLIASCGKDLLMPSGGVYLTRKASHLKQRVRACHSRAGTGKGQFNVWEGSSFLVCRDFFKEWVFTEQGLWAWSTSSWEHNASSFARKTKPKQFQGSCWQLHGGSVQTLRSRTAQGKKSGVFAQDGGNQDCLKDFIASYFKIFQSFTMYPSNQECLSILEDRFGNWGQPTRFMNGSFIPGLLGMW